MKTEIITAESLTAALTEAMTDYLENNGEFRPHNPAIMQDDRSGVVYYGSALHLNSSVVYRLADGDVPDADIPTAAASLAAEIMADIADAGDEYVG